MTIFHFKLSEKLFLRDPQETELGRNIIRLSIKMMDEIGFEEFTFKKLAVKIKSTEASVYRYFDNKHKLPLESTTPRLASLPAESHNFP